MFAATTFDTFWVEIYAWNLKANATISDGMMDLIVGPAGTVFIANMMCGSAALSGGKSWLFPVVIPAGSRVAVRAASALINTTFQVGMTLLGGDAPHLPAGTSVTTYGVTAVPDGTSIATGTGGVKGAWSTITAGTSADHFAFVPSFGFDDDTNIRLQDVLVDLGSGGVGSEVVLGCGNYNFRSISNESMVGPINGMPVFAAISSGSRLAMRAGTRDVAADVNAGVIHAVSF